MKTILVAIDFSDCTEDVIKCAMEFAHAFRAELALVHVAAPDPDFVGYDAGPQSVRDQLAHQFHREHRDLQAIEGTLKNQEIPCRSLLIQGVTVEKIVEETKRLDVGLIIMGSHGHGALHNLLVGSVTEGVIRKTCCPILIVPSRKE